MKTLYITDLDGTLLDERALLADYTRRVLTALCEKGIAIAAATARTEATVLKIFEGIPLRAPLILMNGVVTYDPTTGGYLSVEKIPDEGARQLAEVIEEMNLGGFLYRIDEGGLDVLWSKEREPHEEAFIREREVRYGKKFTRVPSITELMRFPERSGMVYYSVSGREESLREAKEYLTKVTGIRCEFYRDIYVPEHWYLEVCASSASKRRALMRIRERYGFDYVIGFGDNLNDLPLFEACDYKIAVGNARDEVKAAADEVIACNREEGVAHYLHKILND